LVAVFAALVVTMTIGFGISQLAQSAGAGSGAAVDTWQGRPLVATAPNAVAPDVAQVAQVDRFVGLRGVDRSAADALSRTPEQRLYPDGFGSGRSVSITIDRVPEQRLYPDGFGG
jgi:hypothetical protein